MTHRLDYSWLAMEYPKRGKQTYRKLIPMTGLLQKNYGKRQDCTLTSLACIYGARWYGVIEKIALKYGYDGDKKGTNPLTVKAITRELLKTLHEPGKPRSAYGKIVGWNWRTARALAERGIPAVLNLWDDGRGYYHDHSVVLVGVEAYERAKFLLVLDNWHETISLIDYGKLSAVSSLNWVEP